jgi:3-keto-5-aminohexanoate cleavage enzyme
MVGMKVTLRLRMSARDAHYAGELVDGAKVLALFGDLATELLIRLDGDEGLFRAYEAVEFLAPLFAGDFVEATAELVRVGDTSRQMRFEARKVISNVRAPQSPASAADVLGEPVVVCRAMGTCVTPKELQRRPKELYMPALPAGAAPEAEPIIVPTEAPPLVLIAAIAGAGFASPRGPERPLTPRELADEAARCRDAGAAVIQLDLPRHYGADKGSAERVAEAISAIRAKTDCMVQATPGGSVGGSADDRAGPLLGKPELVTLPCGSVNVGDDVLVLTRPQIRDLASRIKKSACVAALECFDVGHVEAALRLAEESAIDAPLHFQLVLGVPGGIGAREGNVRYLCTLLPKGATWSVAAAGRHQQPMTELAIRSGGHARIGPEDDVSSSKGVSPGAAAPLVARAAAYARSVGRPPVDPTAARRVFGVRSPT